MAEVIPFPPRKPAAAEVQTVSLNLFLGAMMAGRADFESIRRDALHEAKLDELRRYDTTFLRRFWDGIGDNSFYEGPEGMFDCADIHRVLNERGDGRYCAV